MPDPRLVKMADVLTHYSLAIRPGDRLVVRAPSIAAPLVKEVYRAALRAGAFVTPSITLSGMEEIRFKESNDEQLTHIPPYERVLLETINKSLLILGDTNTRHLSGADPAKMAKSGLSRSELGANMMKRAAKGELNWCVTLFPTLAYAQEAGMSLPDYENFVYGACLLDTDSPTEGWQRVDREQQHITDAMNTFDQFHVTAPGTDIRYRTGGRVWKNANGRVNFPDGEVFTGPIEDSVNGTVRFTYPAIYHGNRVEGVQLTFRDGKVINASAERGQAFLDQMLNMDAGSRFLGEVAFGLNYNIKRFTGEILFDEKIGGTMHMALGASYPETGGVNESGLHWDMICDLREGQVSADGNTIYRGGQFLL